MADTVIWLPPQRLAKSLVRRLIGGILSIYSNGLELENWVISTSPPARSWLVVCMYLGTPVDVPKE